jgi:hypothetical protein
VAHLHRGRRDSPTQGKPFTAGSSLPPLRKPLWRPITANTHVILLASQCFCPALGACPDEQLPLADRHLCHGAIPATGVRIGATGPTRQVGMVPNRHGLSVSGSDV